VEPLIASNGGPWPVVWQMPRRNYAPNKLREAVLQMCFQDDGGHRTNACRQLVTMFRDHGTYNLRCTSDTRLSALKTDKVAC
jgi:hypothetical protein